MLQWLAVTGEQIFRSQSRGSRISSVAADTLRPLRAGLSALGCKVIVQKHSYNILISVLLVKGSSSAVFLADWMLFINVPSRDPESFTLSRQHTISP